MRIGSLFSGYEGLGMAAEAFYGGTTAWVSDIDKGACKILAHRYPDTPNIGDITKVDWTQVEPVDVLTGGFPCQDVSHAGKRAGLRPDTRSGLWTHMAYAISILRPRYVVAENVRGLLSARAASDVEPCPWCLGGAADGEPDLRALGAVLGDMAELGYDAQWYGLRAADVGAPHGRFRVFVVATYTLGGGLAGRAPEQVGRPLARVSAAGSGADASQDADGSAGGQRRLAAPGQEEGGRPRSDFGGRSRASAADADFDERQREWDEQPRGVASARGSASAPADANHTADNGERSRPGSWVGGAAAADTCGERHGRGQDSRGLGLVDGEAEGDARERERERTRGVAGDRSAQAAADTDGDGLARLGRLDTIRCDADGRGRADRDGDQREPATPTAEPSGNFRDPRSDLLAVSSAEGDASTSWGAYEPAVRRWEAVLGRVAPAPTETSPRGAQRLSPAFVEWMMGLPDGHVTQVPGLTRNEQLKALGNGVVPQQAYAAFCYLHALRAVAA